MKDVQFFKQFNVAWIFSWEYRLQPFLPNPYPLSLVRIYKVKWWLEFKTRLCGKENVEHFCRTNKKKFTLHNLHLFEKTKAIAPATPSKKEKKEQSSSSSTKTKSKGLSQKENNLLVFFKNDPETQQAVLQKILQDNSNDDTASSASSSSHQSLKICRIRKIHMNCKQRWQELVSWQMKSHNN